MQVGSSNNAQHSATRYQLVFRLEININISLGNNKYCTQILSLALRSTTFTCYILCIEICWKSLYSDSEETHILFLMLLDTNFTFLFDSKIYALVHEVPLMFLSDVWSNRWIDLTDIVLNINISVASVLCNIITIHWTLMLTRLALISS